MTTGRSYNRRREACVARVTGAFREVGRKGDRGMHGVLILPWALLLAATMIAPPARGAEFRPSRQAEWEKTVEAARREGQVNVYKFGVFAPLDLFQKAYPEIRLVAFMGRGGHVEQRVFAERRAGKNLADVVIHGVTPNYTEFYRAKILDPIKPALILPEVLDESRWWEGQHHYSDAERQYVFVFVGSPQQGSFHYNTRVVDPKEFRSFWDFLVPKWKGKIVARDIRSAGGHGTGGMIFLYHNPEVGPEYIRRLFAEMDITLFRDVRQGTDWLAQGKFPICLGCADIDEAKAKGLPVDSFGFMKEGAGLAPRAGSLVLLKKAPHPNAAKVFINWLLSREGQIAVQKASTGDNSFREDISKEDVAPIVRRVKGIKYLNLSRAEVLNMEPIFQTVTEGLRQAGKR